MLINDVAPQERVVVKPPGHDNLRVTGPIRWVLLFAQWLISSPVILVSISVAISASAFAVSYSLDQWHWFQRFGAISVSIGAILSTRRLLRIGIKGMLMDENYFAAARPQSMHSSETDAVETHRDLMCSYWGFWVVGFGTLIWAFGDLVGWLL